jgi:antitoxin CptB
MQTVVDARALSKLKWRCRRGLLENDLFIERFFSRHEATLTHGQARGLRALMDLGDNDLLDLLLARTEPGGTLDRPEVRDVLQLMRAPSLDRSHFRDIDHSKERA